MKITAQSGILFVSTATDSLLGCIEKNERGWLLTFLDGNLMGKSQQWDSLSNALRRLKEFVPFSNEGFDP